MTADVAAAVRSMVGDRITAAQTRLAALGEAPGVADDRDQVGAFGSPAQRSAGRLAGGDEHGRVAGRGAARSTVGIGWPVTARQASITSRTEKPVPLPRL